MARITLTKGLPASGKSTWAEEIASVHLNTAVVCKDNIRAALATSLGVDRPPEKKVIEHRDREIEHYVGMDWNVIVADTNLNPYHEEQIREKFGNMAEIDVKFFDVEPAECIRRDKARDPSKRVGPAVIWGMYNKYLKEK